ncbi:MAG: radical SAM protein, partial [Gemmatimonadaceae bacterium]
MSRTTDTAPDHRQTPAASTPARSRFEIILIKPSHYDDDGYVIQWYRSLMPSNSLATLHGLANDASERRVLGPDVDIRVTSMDETNTRVRPDALIRRIRSAGGGFVGLVGVQSNQFPR